MPSVAELIDRGVRAYVGGDPGTAERAWREAQALDPFNDRVRAYLRQVQGERPAPQPPVPAPAEPPGSSPWDAGPASSAPVVVEEGAGIELEAVEDKSEIHSLVADHGTPALEAAPGDLEAWMEGARERFALGDFSGSLELVEQVLRVEPQNAEARAYLRQNESTLVALYESKLGSLGRRPALAVSPEEVLWLNLDHRAGFLLAQIDGTVSYEDLFALSGLPRLDTARILADLVGGGVIA